MTPAPLDFDATRAMQFAFRAAGILDRFGGSEAEPVVARLRDAAWKVEAFPTAENVAALWAIYDEFMGRDES